MSKIRVLPDILASQVAAGEVVERPASVVKELVENSIDAGAGEVLVDMDRGGSALIRVSDDGSGMSREDALLSLERHATSKLRDASDLDHIAPRHSQRLTLAPVFVVVVGHDRIEPVVSSRQLHDHQHSLFLRRLGSVRRFDRDAAEFTYRNSLFRRGDRFQQTGFH